MIGTRIRTRIRTRVGARAGSPAPDLPDLVDAIVAAIGSALVVASVPGNVAPRSAGSGPPALTWFGADLAPAGTPLPYGNYTEPDEDDSPWDSVGTVEARGQLAVQVFATGKAQARALGDGLRDVLHAAAQAGRLRFAAGRLFRFRQSGRSAAQDPDTPTEGH